MQLWRAPIFCVSSMWKRLVVDSPSGIAGGGGGGSGGGGESRAAPS